MANIDRSKQDGMLIYGKNSVLGALTSGHPVEKIVFESGSDKDDRIRAIKDVASRMSVPMEYKVGSWFQKSLGEEPHQGVAAQCARVKLLDMNSLMGAMRPEPAYRSIVLVDQVTDPHNLGAIIRVVAASGAGGLVVTKDRTSPFSPVVVSASAGTAFGIPIAVVANLAYAMERLKKDGYWLYGLDATDGNNYRKEKYANPAAFIVGSEGSGMRELTRKNVDFFVTIPMRSGVESLKVSTALAVVLFRAIEA
jgi:23S rRNA (guanosine2251-2'-O)-methyltransferase